MKKLAITENVERDPEVARKVDDATLARQKEEVERYRRYIREINRSTETEMERSLALVSR